MPHFDHDRQARSLAKYQTPTLDLSLEEIRAIQEGIRYRQGLIEVHRSDEPSAIDALKHHVERSDGQPVLLGHQVYIHGLTKDPSVPIHRESATYVALVSELDRAGKKHHGENTFRVPMTDIHVTSSKTLEEKYQWQHPAFDTHFGWLIGEHGDISRTTDEPKLLLSKHMKFSNDGVSIASMLETALFLSRSALIRALSNTPQHFFPNIPSSASSPYSMESLPSTSRFVPRVGSHEISCSPRRVGHGLWTKVGGWLKKNVQPAMPSSPKIRINHTSTATDIAPDNKNLPAGRAFVDKQQASNLCGVAAINGFLQAPVINAGHAVKEIVGSYLQLLNPNDLPLLPGLFHPKVVNAMRNGESISISREDFFQETDLELHDLMYPLLSDEELLNEYGVDVLAPLSQKNQARVQAQWNSFFNYTHAGEEDLKVIKATAPSVSIHPADWITTFTGLSFEHLINLTNRVLEKERSNPLFQQYPTKVDGLNLSRDSAQRHQQQEWLGMAVEELGIKHLICMSNGNMTGHYFALVQDTAGNWLRLDGLRAEDTSDIHQIPPHQIAQQWELGQKLNEWNVSDVIADERLSQYFQHSLG